MTRLVVVSNRVAPVKRPRMGAEGGLAVAVLAALRERGGVWFGWSGNVVRGQRGESAVTRSGRITFVTVDLSRRDYAEYYAGYANSTLWPLLHYRLDLMGYSRRQARGYRRVNRRFAADLVPHLKRDDLVWVHDYHLIPMAEQLRRHDCPQRMGLFIHTPWPPPEVLTALPDCPRMAESLSHYDLVGFQTEGDVSAFLTFMVRVAGGTVNNGTVHAFGRAFRTGAFPIGIDTKTFNRFAREGARTQQTKRLKKSLAGRHLVIGVDRLDYSKGLVQRMRAFEHLLEAYPEFHRKVTMLQIAPPSRSDVEDYADIRRELDSIAGHVNGRFAEYDWVPIRYLNTGFSRKTLAGFFRISRVGLVTPLRDGMNLVAKEYVAAQSTNNPGVLLLSRFAGAARELEDAIVVNPYDVEGMGEAIREALIMPLAERRRRLRTMYARILSQDVGAWRSSFVRALEATPRNF